MELRQQIEIRPDVMMGKPCLRGTRVPVYLVLQKLGAGKTIKQILAAYPQLTKGHIKAALQYGAALASNEVVLSLPDGDRSNRSKGGETFPSFKVSADARPITMEHTLKLQEEW